LDRAKFFPRKDAFLRELSSASACSAVFFVDDELLLLLLALCHGDMKEKLDMVWFVRRVLVFACRRRLLAPVRRSGNERGPSSSQQTKIECQPATDI
jgi:hypothetical protein